MKKFFAIAALVSALAMTASAAETEYVNRKYNHMIKVEAEAMARNLDSELGLTHRQYNKVLEICYDFIYDSKGAPRRYTRDLMVQRARAMRTVLTAEQWNNYMAKMAPTPKRHTPAHHHLNGHPGRH